MSDRSPEYQAHQRRQDARHHLDLTSRDISTRVDEPLRNLLAACRAVAFTETDDARRSELANITEGLEEVRNRIDILNGRAWRVTRSDWTADDTEGSQP